MRTRNFFWITTISLLFWIFAPLVSATGQINELEVAISDSNTLLSELSGTTDENQNPLSVEIPEDEASFLNKYGVNYCEVNGKQVACEELFDDAQFFLSALFKGMPFLRTMENWFPSLIQFGMIIAWVGLVLSFFGFILWIWMLVDAIKYQKEGRVAWILVIVFFNALWALVYLFAAKIGRKKEEVLVE